MKELYFHFADRVWPYVRDARGLSPDSEPSWEDFIDWYSGLGDYYERDR